MTSTATPPASDIPTRIRITVLASLFLFSFATTALLSRAAITSIDETFVEKTTEAIVRHGSLTVEGVSDRKFSRYSLSPSLLAVPFFALGDLLPADLPDRERWVLYVTSLGSCFASSITVLLLAGWLGRSGYSESIASAVSLLFLFGSLALPYSSSFFIQVVTTPLLLACCWSVAEARTNWSAVAAALLLFTRSEMVLLYPAWILGILGDGLPRRWRRVSLLMLGGILGLIGNLLITAMREDSLVRGAYAEENFTTPLWIGVSGLLFSFSKGLLFHSPLCFAGFLGTFWYARRRPTPGRMILFLLAIQILVVGRWWTWHGGWSWGPRLLLPVLPLAAFPIADWLSEWNRHSHLARRGFLLLATASVLLNVWASVQLPEKDPSSMFREIESLYVAGASPMLGERQPLSPWLWQAPPSPIRMAFVSSLVATALLGLAGSVLALCPRWRPASSNLPLLLAVAGLLALGNLPEIIDFADDVQRGRIANEGQYRQMQPAAGGYVGTLVVPLGGLYAFHNDVFFPLKVELNGKPIFDRSPIHSLELKMGEYPIAIRGTSEILGPLRWTTPGLAYYKAPIPVDYLISDPPTAWQRIRVSWRHYGWLAWIPVLLLIGIWLFRGDDGGEQHGAIESNPVA
ncbi:MAG: hypothetical protein U1D30_01260 [Planctomycetota bacterium]